MDDPGVIAAVYPTDDVVAIADRLPFVDVGHTGTAGRPHGADPSTPEFGATPFDVSDISGYGAYLADGSRHRNLVGVMVFGQPQTEGARR